MPKRAFEEVKKGVQRLVETTPGGAAVKGAEKLYDAGERLYRRGKKAVKRRLRRGGR